MFICKVCGRKFKSIKALGGHTSSAHPQSKVVSAPANNNSKTTGEEKKAEAALQAQAAPPSDDEPGVMERIRDLLRQKYTPKQIKEQFGYAPRTVDQVAKDFIKPEGLPEEEKGESVLPLVLKNGKGEVISPEAVYRQLVESDGIDGERDFRALMKWLVTIEMVQRMTQIRKGEAEAFAETIKPMLDMMEKSRQELDAAAARARESTMQIAEVAAASAAARATAHIDQRFNELKQQKADIATVQDPMKGLMARTMETLMNRVMGMMVGGQVGPTPGLVDERAQK